MYLSAVRWSLALSVNYSMVIFARLPDQIYPSGSGEGETETIAELRYRLNKQLRDVQRYQQDLTDNRWRFADGIRATMSPLIM